MVEEKATSEEEFIERVAGNPIHAYRLMKRLYFDWQTVEKEIKTDNWRSISVLIHSEKKRTDILKFLVDHNRCTKTVGTCSHGRKIS